MVGVPELILIALLLILPIGCIANWLACLQGKRSGKPFVSSDYRHNVPWGIVDLGVVIVVLGVTAGLGVSWVRSLAGIASTAELAEMSPTEQATVFLSFGLATLVATALGLGWLVLRFGRHESLGFSRAHLGSDIELGIRWFLMLIVPVVVLQLALTRWFPTKHPLIEMLRQSGDLSLLPVAAFAAVVSAPLFEEVFFRLLFQGWLEKLHTTMRRSKLGLGGRAERDAVIFGGESAAYRCPVESAALSQPPVESLEADGAAADVLHPAYSAAPTSNPFHPPTALRDTAATSAAAAVNRPVLWIPILLSSALFSLAHFSHGPDWIPLFLLALGLGYLYQRTHRIQACIVVHVLVNALGVLQLWAAIRQP